MITNSLCQLKWVEYIHFKFGWTFFIKLYFSQEKKMKAPRDSLFIQSKPVVSKLKKKKN